MREMDSGGLGKTDLFLPGKLDKSRPHRLELGLLVSWSWRRSKRASFLRSGCFPRFRAPLEYYRAGL